MSSDLRVNQVTRFVAIITAMSALDIAHASGRLYRFSSTVNNVISPTSPGAPGDLPFARGQSVTGSFRYSPEAATLPNPPEDGRATYRGAFTEFSLQIDLGSSIYQFRASDFATPGMPFFGAPLNYVQVADNIPLDEGTAVGDQFTLNHNNPYLFNQPRGLVEPEAIVGAFYPSIFSMFWSSRSLVGETFPEFITDFSLPNKVEPLFDISDNDNWALLFLELPPVGSNTPGRQVNVLGRITSISSVPEPASALLTFLLASALLSSRCKLSA
jgi:hypothetical protein